MTDRDYFRFRCRLNGAVTFAILNPIIADWAEFKVLYHPDPSDDDVQDIERRIAFLPRFLKSVGR